MGESLPFAAQQYCDGLIVDANMVIARKSALASYSKSSHKRSDNQHDRGRYGLEVGFTLWSCKRFPL